MITADHPEQDPRQPEPSQPLGPDDRIGGLQVRNRRLDFVDHRRRVLRSRDVAVAEIDSLGAVQGLRGHQPVVDAVPRHQLRMRPALGDPPILQRQNAVRGNDARKPVGENQGRTAFHELIECFADDGLAVRIDRGQRLIQDEDRRVPEQCAGDRNSLPLSAGQPDAAFADHGAIALR